MFELRDYQRAAVDSINEYFHMNKGSNPVLVEPTGAGKSIIIASYIDEMQKAFPQIRILCLTHVKELLVQNSSKLREQNEFLDIGIYSAGLKMRHSSAQFLFAGIQSVHRKSKEIGHVDICLIDEAHLINTKDMGTYRKFLAKLREQNPRMPCVGFTATPYRLGTGYIYGDADNFIFDGVAHETPIELLIERGYLVPPVAKSSGIHADMSRVGKNSFGEFKEAEMAEAFSEITIAACKDMIKRSAGRHCRLVFCSGVDHAQEVVACLESMGQGGIGYLDGKTKDAERDELLRDVKRGDVPWVVNVGVLTTGFDAPIIDCVCFLRATQSIGLYVQIIGRGLRILDGKVDCLVLDYGENCLRHGPLNQLNIENKDGPPPQKNCPECDSIVPSATAYCPDPNCDHVWKRDCAACEGEYPIDIHGACPLCGYIPIPEERIVDHETEAAEDIKLIDIPVPEWKVVKAMVKERHLSRASGKESMRVTYTIEGFKMASEWVCFDHEGFAKGKAEKWAKKLIGAGYEGPYSLDEALGVDWPVPYAIQILKKKNGYFDILDHDIIGAYTSKPAENAVDWLDVF